MRCLDIGYCRTAVRLAIANLTEITESFEPGASYYIFLSDYPPVYYAGKPHKRILPEYASIAFTRITAESQLVFKYP